MTRERDIERVLEVWLETGPSEMPDRVFDAVLDRIERVPQRHTMPFTRRFQPMTSTLKLVAVTVLATALGLGAFSFLATTTPTTPGSSPSPEPSPTASPKLLPLSFGELEPGTYALGDPLLVPDSPIARMTATVPEGWGGIRGRTFANLFQMTEEPMVGSVGIAIPSNFFVDPCDLTKGRWDPPLGPTVDDFVEAIANVPGYRTSRRPISSGWGTRARVWRSSDRPPSPSVRTASPTPGRRSPTRPRSTSSTASTTACGSWTSTARGSW